MLAAIRLDEDTYTIGDALVLRLMSRYDGISMSTTLERTHWPHQHGRRYHVYYEMHARFSANIFIYS